MNLADIRKKAQGAKAQAVPAPPQWPAPEWQAPPGMAEPSGAVVREEPETGTLPPELDDEPGFDPAAVIFNGRQTGTFQEAACEVDQALASVELLCFRVAAEDYAISIMDIKEIIKPRQVTEVPRVPPFVRGILSLRGIIIPVFDMRVRLGLPEKGERSERERIVVVKRQGDFCGVLVDEVVQVVRIAEAGIEPPPLMLEGIDREFVEGIGRVSGRMLILLNMEKVLDVGLL